MTEIQVIGQSPRYQCSLCDAKFDHNLKFPHLVGAKHRMNVLVSFMFSSPSFSCLHKSLEQLKAAFLGVIMFTVFSNKGVQQLMFLLIITE